MIIDDPGSHFIFVYHPDALSGKKYTTFQGRELTNGEVLRFWGKWIVLGEKYWLDFLALKLNPFVEKGLIPCIKYDRDPPKNLGVAECVMMVYCDTRQRDDIWVLLKKYGVKMKAWVTEKETMELWGPGAPLLERWMESAGLTAAQKEDMRLDAKKRLNRIFENPDELFSPWEQ